MPTQTTVQSTVTAPTVAPAPTVTTSLAAPQLGGNDAAKDKLRKVSGPIGRVWNHILGKAEGSADTGGALVDKALIRAYLDKRLGLAEGEMFRGMKLDGVTDSLIQNFDKDGDGKVSWGEFQAFESQIFALLAPGGEKAGADVGAKAGAQFGKVDGSKDGKANLGELQSASLAAIPKGTDHADLLSQLSARVVMDAADRDESTTPMGKRTLSSEEWAGAAKDTAGRS